MLAILSQPQCVKENVTEIIYIKLLSIFLMKVMPSRLTVRSSQKDYESKYQLSACVYRYS